VIALGLVESNSNLLSGICTWEPRILSIDFTGYANAFSTNVDVLTNASSTTPNINTEIATAARNPTVLMTFSFLRADSDAGECL